jgi:HEAT repeat protein
MRPVLSLLAAAALCALEEPTPQGVELAPLVRDVVRTVAGTPDARPWSRDLAALTDPTPARHGAAIAALVRHGAAVVPDLERLAKDDDLLLRGRICTVAGGIGGPTVAPLLIGLSRDEDRRVRELALLALGRAEGDVVHVRLMDALTDGDGAFRAAAAQAAGNRGDLRALGPLVGTAEDADDPARRARADAVARLLRDPDAAETLARLIAGARGEALARLVEVAGQAADPRLAPVLAARLAHEDGWVRLQAARALAASGDRRALGPLVRAAAADPTPEVRAAAADSLRRLTGYPAGPGGTWDLWWTDHRAAAGRWAEVDGALAAVTAPSSTAPVAATLAPFTPAELWTLAEAAVRVSDPLRPWWPERAARILKADDPVRWLAELEPRAAEEPDQDRRARLAALIDHLGGGAAVPVLRRLLVIWEQEPGVGSEAAAMLLETRR